MASQKEKKSPRRLLNSGRKTTNKKITQRNAQHSPLLTLPAELRNRIYRHVFGDRTIHIYTERENQRDTARSEIVLRHSLCQLNEADSEPAKAIRECGSEARPFSYAEHHATRGCDPLRSHSPERLQLELLKTCRQVHQEAALLPYQLNTFTFLPCISDLALRDFLNHIMPIQGRAIRSLTTSPYVMCVTALKLFEKLKGLHEINIYGFHSDWVLDSCRMEVICQRLEKGSLVTANVCLTQKPDFANQTNEQEEALALRGREKARSLERRLFGSGGARSSPPTNADM